MEPVTTGQIYQGAIPFVLIQLIMVGLVITFPQMVTHYKSSGTTIDPAAVQQKLDNLTIPGLDTPRQWRGGMPGLLLDLEPPKIQ